MKTSSAVLAIVASALVTFSASAGGFDGSSNLVCSSVEVIGCVDGPACLQAKARDFELPEFVFVDFANKVVRATDESGIKEVSPIKSSETTDQQLILQGIENHRGWTMAIDRSTGRMSISSTGPEVDFLIFGACTAL